MPKAFVKLDLRGLRNYRRSLRDGLRSGRGPFAKMLENWGERYLAFLRRRFLRYSAGGGDWKPLAPATLARDRTNRPHAIVRRQGILRVTGTIYRALFRYGSGNLFRRTPKGLQVGFGGPGRHPNAKNGLTVAALGIIHSNGLGVPRRPIVVPPDDATKAEMRREAAAASREALRRSASGVPA